MLFFFCYKWLVDEEDDEEEEAKMNWIETNGNEN